MKPLLILPIIFLSLMMASVVHAKWTKVSESETTSYYINLERIRHHNNKVYFWVLNDWKSQDGVRSQMVYTVAECGPFRLKDLAVKIYDGNMGSGKMVYSGDFEDKGWNYQSPNTIGGSQLEVVCNHKSMQ
jgi:hypothetical protein